MSYDFLKKLQKNAIVKVGNPDSFGTGFFISPDTILTCAHVIRENLANENYEVIIQWQGQDVKCNIIKYTDIIYPDLAIIKVPFQSPSFFEFTDSLKVMDRLYCYGFSKEGKGGNSITFEYEGEINKPGIFLKLKGGQAESGFSGSPVFCVKSKKVVGVLKHSRDIDTDLGGHAIPTNTIFDEYPDIRDLPFKFGVKDVGSRKEKLSPESSDVCSTDVAKAIFRTSYNLENDKFYQERLVDNEFIESLKIGNVWVFGTSGKGKTTLISRNLQKHKKDFLFCDMSPITINKSSKVFEEIAESISEVYDIKRTKQKNILKEICGLLQKCNLSEEFIILIDELSINTDKLRKKIAKEIISLVSYCSNKNVCLSFVISTISKPENLSEKSKSNDLFYFLSVENWDKSLEKLLNLLDEALLLNLNLKSKDYILSKSKDNPRLLKNILKIIYASKDVTFTSVQSCTQKAISEYL